MEPPGVERASLVIDIEEIRHGWADVTFRHGRRLDSLSLSYLNDGLGDFVTVVEQVASGALAGAECRWEHEPGLTSIWVRRCGAGWHDVELLIGAYDGGDLSAVAVLVFTAEFRVILDARDLARATLQAFEAIRERLGIDGYVEGWGYPFPADRLDSLVEYLRRDAQLETERQRIAGLPLVLPQVICHGRSTSREIAAAMGFDHSHVVEAMEYLESIGRFRLQPDEDGVTVVNGSIPPDIERQRSFICRET